VALVELLLRVTVVLVQHGRLPARTVLPPALLAVYEHGILTISGGMCTVTLLWFGLLTGRPAMPRRFTVCIHCPIVTLVTHLVEVHRVVHRLAATDQARHGYLLFNLYQIRSGILSTDSTGHPIYESVDPTVAIIQEALDRRNDLETGRWNQAFSRVVFFYNRPSLDVYCP
jgi:hypothetical protein